MLKLAQSLVVGLSKVGALDDGLLGLFFGNRLLFGSGLVGGVALGGLIVALSGLVALGRLGGVGLVTLGRFRLGRLGLRLGGLLEDHFLRRALYYI